MISINSIDPALITAMILAGGKATRMGGINKGLQTLHGKPLIHHVIDRLKNQANEIIINLNSDNKKYQQFHLPIWLDTGPSLGPLSGFLTGLTHCKTPYLLVVPCDAPFLPLNLSSLLGHAMIEFNAEICMPSTITRINSEIKYLPQPTFCLMKRNLSDSLKQFLNTQSRRITDWTSLHKTIELRFIKEDVENNLEFSNINTLQELWEIEKLITSRDTQVAEISISLL